MSEIVSIANAEAARADEAVACLRPGQTVLVTPGTPPAALLGAVGRREDLRGKVTLWVPDPAAADCLPDGFCDGDWFRCGELLESTAVDVLLTRVGVPDAPGYVGFGGTLLNTRRLAETARTVLAERDAGLIRFWTAPAIDVRRIAALVDVVADPPPEPHAPDASCRAVAGHLNAILRDGDTIGLGYGSLCAVLAEAGAFDGRKDLGCWSLHAPAGLLRAALDGRFRDTVVASDLAVTAALRDELAQHPLFRQRDLADVADPAGLAGIAGYVAIHEAALIDLTGQIVAPPPAPGAPSYRRFPFMLGGMLSPGGRSVTLMRAIAADGSSAIHAALPSGALVAASRTVVDTVITEQGTAELLGRSQRERAMALVGIADPRFRDALEREARALFWPDPA